MKIGRMMIWIAGIGLTCAALPWIKSSLDVILLMMLAAWVGSGFLGWRLARRFPMPTLRAFVACSMLFVTVVFHMKIYSNNSHGYQVLFFLIAASLAPGVGTALGLMLSFAEEPPSRWGPIVGLYFAIGFPLVCCFSGREPLRLAFLASRPALDRLADRIERGEQVNLPERAGVYRIVASRRDPRTGEVLLLIDDRNYTQSGFARNPKPIQPGDDNLDGPALIWLRLGLDPPWSYKYEDTFLSD